MKKIKKILAAVMTLAMVLGMSMTTFAADSTTIRVDNLEEGTVVNAVRVIEPDTEKTTGWDFVEDTDIRNAYATAFGKINPQDDDYQDIIWSLILYADSRAEVPEGTVAARADQINTALKAIPTAKYDTPADEGTMNVFTVTDAGVYAIHAEPVDGSDTVYNPMAAYVGFTYVNGAPTLPADPVVVNAKKTEVPVDKTAIDDDNATGISETVTYQVKTAVPFGASNWKFTDTISGASYVTVPEGQSHEGEVPVSVKIGTGNPTTYYATVTGSSFVLDLSTLAKDPAYQGAEVTFTYQAVVTGVEVNNKIEYAPEHSSDQIKLYTGSITFTKLDESNNKLGGAGFVVSREDDNGTEYAVFSGEGPTDYVLTGWVSTINDATEIFTDNVVESSTYGTLKISGLDKGTYHFKETTAPEGYSINEKGKDVTFPGGTANAAFETTGDMTDTQLSALPSTGGIGTTIFTIGGCIIMIAAAGLFFASRRNSSK